MSYVWVYLHRSYIVMDPPTCDACLGSFAGQKIVLSRDTSCVHPKTLNPVYFHECPPYLPMD